MSKIVLTYFEPFGNRTTNASKEVVSLFKQFETHELPVSWRNVLPKLSTILNNNPDYLFLVGEAGSYREITIEKVAHNIADGIDNDGVIYKLQPIISGAPDILKTTCSINCVNYSISDNAGKYLCNYSYFMSLSMSKNTRVLFVHLPYIEKEGPNSLINLFNSLKNIINLVTKED